jgi:hypothetical protein
MQLRVGVWKGECMTSYLPHQAQRGNSSVLHVGWLETFELPALDPLETLEPKWLWAGRIQSSCIGSQLAEDNPARHGLSSISKMDFSHWEPPGVSVRMWSVNLEVSISGENKTIGGHSARPTE